MRCAGIEKVEELWRIEPGSSFELSSIDPSSSGGIASRRAAEEELVALQGRLMALQDRLWAESRQSLLLVLQGIDASGKDGTITHVFRSVNPQGMRIAAFKEPTPLELAHDFLWRVHREVPTAGQIGIFNRSHYEDVVTARVRHLVEKSVWQERYGHINAFEALLSHRRTTIIKVLLHISRDEQQARFQERSTRPDKLWKIRQSDLDDRRLWDDYQHAFADMVVKTSTELAPWYVLPADRKWYRNWAVSHILVEALEKMDPRYPEPVPIDGLDQL